MKYEAILHTAEEGGYWSEVPALPGCFTEGESLDEIIANLKEAVEGILDIEIPTGSVEIVSASS